MKNLTIINIILLLNGLIIHFIYAMLKQKKQDIKFSTGFYIKDNWMQAVAIIICAFSSLIMADDIAKIMNIQTPDGSPYYSVHAFISGLLPMYFINKIFKLFKASPEL